MRERTSSTKRTVLKVRGSSFTFIIMLGLGNNSNQNLLLRNIIFILSLQIFQFCAQMLLKLTELNCKLVNQLSFNS